MRSSTDTIIKAMRYLSEDIDSEDGVANAAIAEAALRLEELDEDFKIVESENNDLRLENKIILQNQLVTEKYIDKLINHISYLPKDLENSKEANLNFAEENQQLLQCIKTLQEDNERLTFANIHLEKRKESLLARMSKNDRRIWL